MAQTTPLIKGIFDEIFADQIDASAGSNKSKVWIKVLINLKMIAWQSMYLLAQVEIWINIWMERFLDEQ